MKRSGSESSNYIRWIGINLLDQYSRLRKEEEEKTRMYCQNSPGKLFNMNREYTDLNSS